jgi:DNA polymerase V
MSHTAQNLSICASSSPPLDNNEGFDLAAHLIKSPYDTFYVRVSGDSMVETGVFDGDILIVDRSVEPKPTDIVVAQVGDGFTVKRFNGEHGRLRLVQSNLNQPNDTRICGVALFAIHRL